MFSEDDLLPISALQHMVFCERQAALIHVERAWEDNAHTIQGKRLHDMVDEGGSESRGDVRIVRSLPLRSLELSIAGLADVVEFHRTGTSWRPFPVEYKKGKPKRHRADEVQLCAQTFCLEEMFDVTVADGSLFYGKVRRRLVVPIDETLRELTRRTILRFRWIIENRLTPPPVNDARCRDCSLVETCRPRLANRSASRYLASVLRQAGESGP